MFVSYLLATNLYHSDHVFESPQIFSKSLEGSPKFLNILQSPLLLLLLLPFIIRLLLTVAALLFSWFEQSPHQIILLAELELPLLHLLHLSGLQIAQVVILVTHRLDTEGGEAPGGVTAGEPGVGAPGAVEPLASRHVENLPVHSDTDAAPTLLTLPIIHAQLLEGHVLLLHWRLGGLRGGDLLLLLLEEDLVEEVENGN